MDNRGIGFFKGLKITKYAKRFLLASLALAVLAAVVVAAFGFSLAYQYKGGYRITVQIEDNRPSRTVLADYKESVTEAVEKLKDADGEEYGLEIVSARADSLDIAGIKMTNLVLTAKLLDDAEKWQTPRSDAFMIDLKNALDEKGYKTESGIPIVAEVVGVDYNAPVSFADAFVNPLTYAILAGVLMCVYFAFRYDLKEAVVTAYILFSGIILFLAVTALARVPVGSSLIALIGLVMIESVFGLAVLFGRIKSNRGTPGYAGLSDAALAETAYRESFTKLLLTACVSAVAALALLIGTADSMVFAAGAFIAVLCGAANSIFVAPAVYGLFMMKKPARAAVPAGAAKVGAKDNRPRTGAEAERKPQAPARQGFVQEETPAAEPELHSAPETAEGLDDAEAVDGSEAGAESDAGTVYGSEAGTESEAGAVDESEAGAENEAGAVDESEAGAESEVGAENEAGTESQE